MDPFAESSHRNSDADVSSPAASSNYSSCDGSEFDRYCSANSVLGSASLCSSVGNYSDLLDSIKSSNRWNGFDGLLDAGGAETPRANGQGVILMDGMSCLSEIRTGSKLSRASIENSTKFKGKSAAEDTSGCGSASDNLSCEHSEGEDSSIGYGSDDESRMRFVNRNSLQCNKETENESGNPLVMNSLVAFGANDWDEFEQERGGDGLGSMSLFEDQSIDHVNASSVIEKENYVKIRSSNEVSSSQKPRPEEKSLHGEEVSGSDTGKISNKQMEDESELTITPLCNSIFEQSYNALNRAFEGKDIGDKEVDGAGSLLSLVGFGQDLSHESIAVSDYLDMAVKDPLPNESEMLETFDSYDDTVLEMEEILLDSTNSHGARSTQAETGSTTHHSHHLRDSSSTASTSGADDTYPLLQNPPNIDRVEVVGAKQKKGDVSFGERLVGVKEYTIYKLRVWSDKDQWEVERRYRDFFALYHQLYTLFTEHGLKLPSPWSKVERESRKIFGNASPDVITVRSILIQDCLQSILNSTYPFGTPNSLVSFLSPGQNVPNSSLLKSLIPQSLSKLGKDQRSNSLGKTISLVVEIKPRKSMRQLLEAQHYLCAGCHRQLDAGKTLLREIVQTFGWNKPRFCEYTSQLFCGSCHTNDTVVLPAKVLHHWDFSLYPVSQMAKAYMESIYDQPMLCVSAVNPFLFSKVPALQHVMGIRKKIGAMLPYVRCPFRKAVQRSLGIRRYLLESNDFFALRDLVDFSKGAFAALPIMVETVSNKILEHITEQCLVCYDSGIPCAARQECDDPASLIFPFQEAEAAKCSSCGSIFHKPCYVKLMGCCPCGKSATSSGKRTTGSTNLDGISNRTNLDGISNQLIQSSSSSSSSGFLTEIFSKARPDKIWRPKNSSPVILMGSLPSTSL